jgi:hypothetical protein
MRRQRWIARLALALSLVQMLAAPASAESERRLALIVGNSAYKDTPLPNPVNDARAMTARLKQLGFDVMTRENATRAQFAAAIAEYAAKITPSTVALLFYAGHGLQVRGRNYLVPVDAEIDGEASVPFATIDMAQIVDAIDHAGARLKLIVLDACRNNPFERRVRGAAPGRGLAPMDAARGSLLAFATAPGSVADDGDGDNSVYTAALLMALAEPGLKAEDVFKRTRMMVLERTRGAQTPWEQSALTGDLVLNPVAPPPAAAAPPKPDTEMLFWQSAQTGNRVEEYRAYLRQYPQGAFATLARSRIAALEAQQQIAAAASGTALLQPQKAALVGSAKAVDVPAPPPPATKDLTPADVFMTAVVSPPSPPPQPSPQVAAVAPPAASPAPRMASDLVQAMMRRADAMVLTNDLGAARLFYERLALEGHRPAALALARSYDPAWLRQRNAIGVQPDPTLAAYWLTRADAMVDLAAGGEAR